MENQQNNISPHAILSAIVGMMFLAPFIDRNVKADSDFSAEEREFIMWYIKVWYVNLIFLVIVLAATLWNLYYIHPALSRIITIGSFVIYIITIFSLFACVNGLTMRKTGEKIVVDIQNKWQLLKAYIPILNFIYRFRQENYNMPYRWLKESVLLRTIFIFGTLLFWNLFGIWVVWVIVIRVLLLMINIDVISLSMKKAINMTFSCNPWEITAYLFAPIVSKLNHTDYDTVLQARKQSYAQWQNFWIWIILQYLWFLAILYFIYRNSIDIDWIQIVLLIAIILRITRVIIFYKNKKTFLRIPILSEITSLVFH